MKVALPASSYPQVLRVACLLGLVALGLMVWSLLDPRPVPVLVAMSVGQVLGTLSLAIFVLVVVVDVRRTRAALLTRSKGAPE